MVMVQEIPARDELVTLREASEQFGIAVTTLRYHLLRGRFPQWQQRGVTLVRRADVAAFVEAQRNITPREG